jgi:uncharacterized integral membrane protein
MLSERTRTTIEAPQDPELQCELATPQAAIPAVPETRAERFGRKAHRTRLHLYATLTVGVLVCLVALVVANTRQVKLSWVVGSSTASLVWIVLSSAILGWLLGISTGALFRWRTRARRA